MELLLLRHGETAGNQRRAFVGVTDEVLCVEARTALTPLTAVDAVFASPLARCVETATLCYPGMKPIFLDALQETNFGQFEGKTHSELESNPQYQEWLRLNGETVCHGGETVCAFKQRVRRGFQEVVAQSVEAGWQRIAIVTHGGCIMAILEALSGQDFYHWQTENGAGYQFQYDPKSGAVWNIRSFRTG